MVIPLKESAASLYYDRIILASQIINATFYGIHFTIFFLCFRLLLREFPKTRHTYFFLFYISISLILATISIITSSLITQHTFIDDRNSLGGTTADTAQDYTSIFEHVDDIVGLIAAVPTDALLLWRGLVIYRGTRWIWIMILPSLMQLGYIATAIRFAMETLEVTLTLPTGYAILLPCILLTQGLNIIVTLFIIIRLLIQRRKVVRFLGVRHVQHYVSVIAMIVESASLSAFFAIFYLILYALNHPVQNIIIVVLSRVALISPLLIIYRVAQGRAWSKQTPTTIMAFQEDSQLQLPYKNVGESMSQATKPCNDGSAAEQHDSDYILGVQGHISISTITQEDVDYKP